MRRLSPFEKICFPQKKPVKIGDKTYQLDGTWKGHRGAAVGIDPGVNYGMTCIIDDVVQVVWGKLPPTKVKGVYALAAHKVVFDRFDWEWANTPAVVEGAAYNAKFGQVGLEEVRIGFYIGLWQVGFKVRIVPPKTVRLHAFGDGTVQAMDVWPTINHNGADSIGMALEALYAQ